MGHDCGNVVEALRDCLSLPTIEAPITFCVQKQEDVSRQISVHKKHRHCPNRLHTETEQYKHSPSVPMALVVSFKRTLQILEVLLMLLIIAGDVEINPGPVHKLTLSNLYEELLELTDPFSFGKELGIPQLELDRIQRDHPEDMKEQKMALCQYIVDELTDRIDWEKIADVLKDISMEDLAVKIRQKYCQQAGKLMPNPLVELPAVQHGRKRSLSRANTASDTQKKKQKLETSDASLPAIIDPPTSSPSGTLSPQAGKLMPNPLVELPAVQHGKKHSLSRANTVSDKPKKKQKLETSGASLPASIDPPTSSSSSTVTLQELVKRHHLTDVQLNCEIRHGDIPRLAKYFDTIELYPKLMNLDPAEEQDVVNTLHANGNQVAMSKCLSLWKGHDPFKATYVALLEVLLKLEKGEIANNVCLYLAEKNGKVIPTYTESSGALIREFLSSDLSDSSELFTSSDHTTDSISLSGSQQVPRLQFECGCGKCTVYSFITGETTCRNPKAFPFPKLAVPGIPSDDIGYIEYKLRQQSTEVSRHFGNLVLKTFIDLPKRSVDLHDFIVYLKLILSTSSEAEDCLDHFVRFDQIGIYLKKQQYCSWFDYELIEHLRSKYLFTIPNNDSDLNDYKAKFKTYVSQRCFIYLHDDGPWPKHQVKVKFKIDLEYNQLSHTVIKRMKGIIVDVLGTPKYHLCFKEARKGCTELIFGAPLYFGEISQLSKYQKSQLKAHGFLKVTIMEQTLLEVDPEEVRLKNSGSVSSHDNSELSEISSTCRSDGEEADIDTTDLEYTSTGRHPGYKVEITYDQILTAICESELELQEEMDLDVSPCSLWKALHNGQQCMALKYNGEDDMLKFNKYIEDLQRSNPNVMPAKCFHFVAKLSSHPIILFELQQPIKEYCFSSEALSEIQQLSLLLNAAISVLGFAPSITLQVTTKSLFVHKSSTNDTKAMFLPIYKHSYFHQLEPKTQPDVPSLNWLNDTLLLMVHRKQYSSDSKLPENHILFNIFKHRWFPDDKPGCSSTEDVAKELQHILELEETRLEMIDTLRLADSEYLEVPHLHMLLIGHTGVGKTSIRKHLQNIPFNNKEKSTIIMEQELLYQETFESTIDSKKSTMMFKKYDSVYKSDPDKIYLTLWDTGGQPMFQDLLPCFAKIRSIYGIVVRLCDLLDNSTASIRPTCPLEIERESPYTSTDYLYRCLSFLDSASLDLHLPDMLKKGVFEAASGTTLPKIAFIGTFKDQIKIYDKQDLEQVFFQLKNDLKSMGIDLFEKVLLPSTFTPNSVMFEIDNTQSGAKYEDPGMKALREQIVSCTKSAKVKIPSKWIAFKIDLERESHWQAPCTGVVTFEKASEIAEQHKTDLKAALCYFHELGIFIWYHDKKHLQEYVFVEPKNLLSILGTILDPQVYIDLPEQWKQLQAQGILNVQVGERLLANSKTGIPLSWILSFFEEHHLAMPLLEGYFIPSMLQVLPICPNHQHVFDASISACSVLSADLEVAPLFLVPKSKFVPPGFFPRLMTVLSGIKEGNIIWKLSPDFINCKNIVLFEINNQFRLVFTEFIDCVRAHFDGLTDDNIPHHDLCLQIVSTLNVQLQRVISTQSVRLTFVCFCSKNSSSIHFLKCLPFTTDNHVPCGEHGCKQMELTTAHKIWLSDEHHPKIATLKDAEARFEAAMEGKKFGLRFSTILFTGLPGSDVYACKQMIMDKNFTPFESPHLLDPIQPGAANIEFSYYTLSGERFKTLQDADLDMVFACNAAVQTPKRAGNDKSGMQQEPKEEALSENPENNPCKQETPIQSVGKEVPRSIPAGNSPQHLISNQILIYEPIPEESLLKCDSSENIMQLMVNHIRSLTRYFDNLTIIKCVCCSDVWLLNVVPIFLKGITIGINYVSLSQDLEEKIVLQDISGSRDKIQVSLTSKQLIKDVGVLATKLLVVGKHAEVQSIETNERKSDNLFRDNGQAKFITDEDGKQAIFEVGKSRSEIENIEQQLASSLALSELKQVSLSWHMLGHAIKKVMQQYNRKFISKQEVLIIATKFRLSITDLEIALLNLHTSGLILYFGNVLPNVIFKDSTVLIELIAQINLYNQGAIIPITAFEALKEMYAAGLFTCKEATSLFKDLHILIELETSLFLMPCLMREEVSVETLSSIFSAKDTEVAPLVIQCSLALGIFEYMMCYLCSQYNGHPWPWKINAPHYLVFKNCVQFVLPGVNALITLYRNNAEMTVYVTSTEDHEILPSIRAAVVNGLNKAAEAFHISGQALPVVGFHCTCGQVDNTHMIVPSKEGHWRCSATNEIIAQSSTQNVWFTKTHEKGADTVTVHNVFAELVPWSSSWYKVGMLFNLESDVLETITIQYRQDTDTALMEVIRKWFHTHHNPSWEEVQLVFLNLKQSDSSLIERYSMTEDVFKECLPNLTIFVSISTLLPYLLKYRLVHVADVDSVQSPYLDNLTKISNLLNLTKRNGGKNGFDLLYGFLFKTSEEHRGHDEIIQELDRYANAFSSSTMNPIAIDPSILEPPGADYAVESVDALIREVSDHIGRDWMVLARSLGFTETDIQSIEYADERDLKEQIHQFFYEWKRRDGQDATQDKLITVLYESGLNEVLKKTKAQKNSETLNESEQALKEAMKAGFVRVNTTNILFFGMAGTGKTSTKHLLLGLPPPVDRNSTPLAGTAERICIRNIRETTKMKVEAQEDPSRTWKTVSSEDLQRIVADAIKSHVTSSDSQESAIPQELSIALKQLEPSIKFGTSVDATHLTSRATEPSVPGANLTSSKQEGKKSKLLNTVSNVMANIQRFSDADRTAVQEKFESHWIYIIDSGGQPRFHNLLPLFMPKISVALYILRLSDCLDDHPLVEYYKDNQPAGEGFKSHLSVLDNFKYLVQSIQFHSENCKLVCIGTHKDRQSECKETLSDKNKTLLNFAEKDCIKKLTLFFNLGLTKEIIFPVDCKHCDSDSKEVAKTIREYIHRLSQELNIEILVPFWWFIFLEIVVEKVSNDQNRKILSKTECVEIAKVLHNFHEDALYEALKFFHEHHIFHYYPAILPNVVFCDAQVLLDKVTELVEYAAYVRGSNTPIHGSGKWLDFTDKGIITIELLSDKNFKKHYVDGLFAPIHLIEIFKHLLIATPFHLFSLEQDKRFYMPSLLSLLSPTQVNDKRADLLKTGLIPLVLYFKSNWQCCGVFCCLQVYLIKECEWEMEMEDHQPSRNFVQLIHREEDCFVTLIDGFSFLEVHSSNNRKDMLSLIYENVHSGLRLAYKALKYTYEDPEVAFLCPHELPSTEASASPQVPHHPARVLAKSTAMRCTLCNRMTYELGKGHKDWLWVCCPSSQPSVLGSETSVEFQPHEMIATAAQLSQECSDKALLQLSTEIAGYNKYKHRLGLSYAEIENIDQKFVGIPGKFHAALKKWKSNEMNSTATYGRLVEIAAKIEDGEAVRSIHKACVEHTRSSPEEYTSKNQIAQKPFIVLTGDDILTIYEKLRSASKNWFKLGLALGVSYYEMENIQDRYQDNDRCLMMIVTKRLEVTDPENPMTWPYICECLRRPTVERNDVAEEIEALGLCG